MKIGGDKLAAKTGLERRRSKYFNQTNLFLLCLAMPMFIYKIIFHYVPMAGIVLAFKEFRYDTGIFRGEWVGFKNFEFFFRSPDAWRTVRNTVGYSLVFMIIGTIATVVVALLLYELTSRAMAKYMQTTMLLPHFMSWVIVAFIAYGFLSYGSGLINNILEDMGLERVRWYAKKEAWIFIIPLVNTWKHIGMGSLVYYASLMGVDPSYHEAAKVEGANRFQIMTKINLPFLYPLIIMLSILAIGRIFNADFGLFYQLPKGSVMVLDTTDVIETYVFRALREQGNISMATAVGLYKSFVGLVMVILTNQAVKKLSPENTLF
jgi:putative aldouronate transport system permease protein